MSTMSLRDVICVPNDPGLRDCDQHLSPVLQSRPQLQKNLAASKHLAATSLKLVKEPECADLKGRYTACLNGLYM